MFKHAVLHGVILMTLIAMAAPALSGESDCPLVTGCFTPGRTVTETIVAMPPRGAV